MGQVRAEGFCLPDDMVWGHCPHVCPLAVWQRTGCGPGKAKVKGDE